MHVYMYVDVRCIPSCICVVVFVYACTSGFVFVFTCGTLCMCTCICTFIGIGMYTYIHTVAVLYKSITIPRITIPKRCKHVQVRANTNLNKSELYLSCSCFVCRSTFIDFDLCSATHTYCVDLRCKYDFRRSSLLVCTCIRLFVCTYTCTCARVYMYMYVCMYVCAYIYIYVHMHASIHL